jgi:hypothetical protein
MRKLLYTWRLVEHRRHSYVDVAVAVKLSKLYYINGPIIVIYRHWTRSVDYGEKYYRNTCLPHYMRGVSQRFVVTPKATKDR